MLSKTQLIKLSKEIRVELATLSKVKSSDLPEILRKAHRTFGARVRNLVRILFDVYDNPIDADEDWVNVITDCLSSKLYKASDYNAQDLANLTGIKVKTVNNPMFKAPEAKAYGEKLARKLKLELSLDFIPRVSRYSEEESIKGIEYKLAVIELSLPGKKMSPLMKNKIYRSNPPELSILPKHRELRIYVDRNNLSLVYPNKRASRYYWASPSKWLTHEGTQKDLTRTILRNLEI